LARAQETPVRPRDQELSVSAGERHYVVLPLTLRVPAFAVAGQQALMPVLEQARPPSGLRSLKAVSSCTLPPRPPKRSAKCRPSASVRLLASCS
jgi:hypothetical protein